MRNYLKDERGYTLVESILQLVILLLMVQCMVLLFYWKISIDNHIGTQTFRQFELFSIELQQILESVEKIEIQNGRRRLQVQNELKYLIVEQSGTVIRQRSDKGGHIPLFVDIRDMQLMIDGQQLHVEIITTQGQELKRTFVIGSAT